jgi:hypothetical protein
MALLIFALAAPVLMAFFGLQQLFYLFGEKTATLPSKIALTLLVASMIADIYLLLSLYF